MSTRNTNRYRLFGKEFLAGGLNITDNPIIVDFNQMTTAENILIGSTRARRKRFGTTLYNIDTKYQTGSAYPANPANSGGSVPVRGGIEFTRYDTGTGTTKTDQIVRSGTKLWSVDDRNTVGVDRTGALTLATTGRICFQPFENASGPALYFCSTTTADLLNRWDGAAASASTPSAATAPGDWKSGGVIVSGPSILTVFKGRMFAAGVPGFPYRVYYSKVRDGDDWTDTTTGTRAGSFDLDAIGDPQGVTGLCVFQDRLYVFMRRAIYEVTISDPASVADSLFIKPITTEIGCVSHATIKVVGNDVVYASDRGILTLRSTDKAIESEYNFLSRDIQRAWNESINHSLLNQAWATIDEQESQYYISLPSSGATTNDLFFCLNLESGGWSNYTGMKARSMWTTLVSNKPRVTIGREDGYIVLLGETTRKDLAITGTSNAGTDYNAIFKSGVFYPGNESDIEHIFKSITILAATTSTTALTVQWEIDGKIAGSRQVNFKASGDVLGSTFILGTSSLATGTFVPRTVQITGKGYGIRIQVIMPESSDIEIFGFIIETKAANAAYV